MREDDEGDEGHLGRIQSGETRENTAQVGISDHLRKRPSGKARQNERQLPQLETLETPELLEPVHQELDSLEPEVLDPHAPRKAKLVRMR